MSSPVAVIVGAGPGVGAALARLLGRRGWAIALIARDEGRLTELGESLQAEDIMVGWTALDVSDTAALTAAVTRFGGFGGQIDLLHHNAVAFRSARGTELTAAQLLADVMVGAASLLTSVQAALPFLRPGSVGWPPEAAVRTTRCSVRPASACRRRRCATWWLPWMGTCGTVASGPPR